MKVAPARHLVVRVELPANQRKPDDERRDAEDRQQCHGVTTITQVAVGSSNFIVVVHIACHGLRDSNPAPVGQVHAVSRSIRGASVLWEALLPAPRSFAPDSIWHPSVRRPARRSDEAGGGAPVAASTHACKAGNRDGKGRPQADRTQAQRASDRC